MWVCSRRPDTFISPVTGRPAHPLCGKRALPGQAEHSTLLQSVPTFREVMDFRTSARLVVPSACESGLGAQNRGEGIQGLTRAGCLPGRVVASQWRVDDDATAEVMGGIVPGAARPRIWASNPVQNRTKFTPNSGFMRDSNK